MATNKEASGDDNTAAHLASPLFQVNAGYCNVFPAPGLRRTVRHITGVNEEGQSIFLSTDCGDHHRVMGNEQAVANILYSTKETPANLNNNEDTKYGKDNESRESSSSSSIRAKSASCIRATSALIAGLRMPGMLWILLDCTPIMVNGKALEEELAELAPYYLGK
ncbi:hypothetical protein DM02DRAFT_658302 [Periconia macrospinosa]|uniref:Uncharacterized protein n=1 Tax=Periconia macrospinosa TaxID=97972 RepID=A0A2V1DGZ4_9PLEO|nr:hypothetical protein DM02DRAFT_658302 [Periconia macrospinosa]